MRWFVSIVALLLAACGSAPVPEKKAAVPPPLQVKDHTALLPPDHRTGAQVVPDHVLGIAAMPGGTVGDYADGGTKYQMFIIDTQTAQDAAFLLLDMKGALTDPAYIAYMGGYFGTNAGKPVYVFAKLDYLAGVVGLDREKADPIARGLAARLN
jgi:hypothetical protein